MLDLDSEFMRPVVKSWIEKIHLARKAKDEFNLTADSCMNFFAGAVGWMYEDEQRRRFTKRGFAPRFRVTLNKAFELVAIFGPTLYHRNPVRTCKPYPPLEFGPESFGDPSDPAVQQFYQRMAAQQALDHARSKTRCALYQAYSSYTPREQPGGGLETAASDAITEALIKGLGVLWPECYLSPGGNRKLTGLFLDSTDNLFIDPDAKTPDRARWIAQRCQAPHWQLEKARGLPEGSLKKYSNDEYVERSVTADVLRTTDDGKAKTGSFDQVTYWKIWSKAGVHRLKNTPGDGVSVNLGLTKSFDEVVGDYAYLEVVHDLPYPLNAPIDRLRGADEEEVKRMFAWPVPYYASDRLYDGASLGSWPVSMLSFYHRPNTLWPISPMAPGLGELTILNIFMSAIVNRVWQGSRTFIAVLRSAAEKVKPIIEKGDDLCVFELDHIHKSIDQVVSFLKQPEITTDVWQLLDRTSLMFDKRVGLSELLYGLNVGGSASRSATDIDAKKDMLGIRIGDMAQSVEKWLGDGAAKEKVCAYWNGVSGRDVQPLVGQAGAYLWDRLIAQEDPEVVFKEMYCTIECGSAKRPNRDRDTANMNQLFPALGQMAQGYAQLTGDPNPLNNLVQDMGKVLEQPLDDVKFGPFVPLALRMQMEQGAQGEQGPTPEQQQQQQSAEQHQQDLRQAEELHQQELRQGEEAGAQKAALAAAQLRMKRLQARAKTTKS